MTEGSSAPLLSIDIVTLFPPLFESWLKQGVVSRAIEKHVLDLQIRDLRPFGVGRHQVTDDYPFGGGAGMVMKPEPLFASLRSLDLDPSVPVILLSPQGRRFDQKSAEELSGHGRLVLVSGHYEGVDERVREHAISDELSVGDYVLSAGELAAMVVADAVVRLLPGALAEESTLDETFNDGLLEYPQFTRPSDFEGRMVPEILLSGNHGEIAKWRRRQALRRTFERRPDLLRTANLTSDEQALVTIWSAEPLPPSAQKT